MLLRSSKEPENGRRSAQMDNIKYIWTAAHWDTISAAVLNGSGRLIQQSVLMTRAAAILGFHRRRAGYSACDLRRGDTFGLAL